MRYLVHADQARRPVEFEFQTAAEAIAKAWSLMGSGATDLYIFDKYTYEAFSPGEFVGLFRMTRQSHGIKDEPKAEL